MCDSVRYRTVPVACVGYGEMGCSKFVETFELNGGLYDVIFRLLFFARLGGWGC